ncbi:ParA family protein (plasmid) [Pseudonocardia sp. DSM 110487]|nr:ParA family protein [Pseudonocardia sp. DSM 110487]
MLGVGSPKGGVGKTTCAVTLAQMAAEAGYHVLLYDADENRSAFDWVTRSGDLMSFDVRVDKGDGRLARLHELTEYDVIIVDLPGERASAAWSLLIYGTVKPPRDRSQAEPAVDALLVPSAVRVMDLRVVVRMLREVVQPSGIPYLLVGNLVKTPSVPIALSDLTELAGAGVDVARTILRDLSVHAEAVTTDRPITRMPGGKRSTARAAEREFRSLARETFAGLLGMKWSKTDPLSDSATTEGMN